MTFSRPADRFDHNPNLRHRHHIVLRAFNLTPGAAFMSCDEPDPRVWVVQQLQRDSDFERVYVWAATAEGHGLVTEKAFDLDFNSTVALIGIAVDPQSDDLGVN